MAGFVKKVVEKALPIVKNEKSPSMECAVCLQTCVHPAELPCGHIFCYLCIKGIVNQGRRCAMCRRDIPVDYLDKPRLLNPVEAEISNQGFEDGHVWFYEGHNGWWQYDERTSLELEAAYQKGERCCELLIAGFLYVADFDEMLQSRRNDPSRRRRIKRDLATTNKKGVAGLKTTKSTNSTAGSSNELPQSWSTSTTAEISPDRNFPPAISTDTSEPSINHQQSRERTGFELPHSSCSSIPRRHSSPSADNPARLPRNLNLDNVVHETLDWTLEQIESLNLELLNDYEALFRDANNYEQPQGNSNRVRSERVVNNYLTQYLNRNYSRRDSPLNDSEADYRDLDLSGLSIRDTDPLPVSSNETQSESNVSGVSPNPDAFSRGESRRRNFLRRSSSLNHEIGASKFS